MLRIISGLAVGGLLAGCTGSSGGSDGGSDDGSSGVGTKLDPESIAQPHHP